jgi:hypothetical protein
VIEIPGSHVLDIGVGPRLEEASVVVRVLPVVPTVEGLIHDQEAEAIGDIEQLGRGRVVGGAKPVGAHVLENLESLFDGAIIGSRAQGSEVVVVA